MIDLVAAFKGQPPGGVLIDEDIERLQREAGLISDFDPECLQPASYDLRLGSEYFLGEPQQLTDAPDRTVTLAAGQFMLVTSREELKLPLDVVARAGLMSGWAQKGLISLFSTQIDPGFVGIMVVPLLNAGHADVVLKFCAPIFSVEFMRTTRPVTTGWVNLPTNSPLRGIPATKALQMASPPDLASVKERLAALEASRTWEEGFRHGKGEKQAATGTRWGKIGGIFGIIGGLASAAAIVVVILQILDVIDI